MWNYLLVYAENIAGLCGNMCWEKVKRKNVNFASRMAGV